MTTKPAPVTQYVCNKTNLLWEGTYYQPGDVIPGFDPLKKPSALSAKLIVPSDQFDPKRKHGKPVDEKNFARGDLPPPPDPREEFDGVTDEVMRRIAVDYGAGPDMANAGREELIAFVLKARVQKDETPKAPEPVDLTKLNRQQLVDLAKERGIQKAANTPTDQLIKLLKG